jgi:gamma-D-glutamyl-L-lysine dipeptidyl-peptidase
MQGVPEQVTTSVIGRAGAAPVGREPSLKSEQVTQLVLGETGRVLEGHGEWRRVRLDGDHYEGWVHGGYVLEVDHEIAAAWRERARAWSEGAVVLAEGVVVRLPVRARVGLALDRVDLPDGRQGRVVAGAVGPLARVAARARGVSPEVWAARTFAGTPYQWGGVTPWGVDCSGLVQSTFLARGVALPRDASQQVAAGDAVAPGDHRPGDLLFFSERDRITHVAFAGEGDTLVHSTVRRGGFVIESWRPGTEAAFLHDRLVAVRRLPG